MSCKIPTNETRENISCCNWCQLFTKLSQKESPKKIVTTIPAGIIGLHETRQNHEPLSTTQSHIIIHIDTCMYIHIYLYLYSYTCTNIQQERIYKSFPFLAPFQRAQTTALHHSQPSKRQKNAHRNTKSIHFQTDFFARSPSLHPIGSTCIAIIAAMTHTMHLLVDHHLVRHIAKGHDHSHTNGVKNNGDLFLGGTCLVRL